jgi:hypothetical protein
MRSFRRVVIIDVGTEAQARKPHILNMPLMPYAQYPKKPNVLR